MVNEFTVEGAIIVRHEQFGCGVYFVIVTKFVQFL